MIPLQIYDTVAIHVGDDVRLGENRGLVVGLDYTNTAHPLVKVLPGGTTHFEEVGRGLRVLVVENFEGKDSYWCHVSKVSKMHPNLD